MSRGRTAAAIALHALALVALGLALLGALRPGLLERPRILVLVDRSDSVPRALADRALDHAVDRLQADGRLRLQSIEFAGRPSSTHGGGDGRAPPGALDPSATDIEAALDVALALHARQRLDAAVVVSDGFATRGDTRRALRAAVAAGLQVRWVDVGRPADAPHLSEVAAPDRADAGTAIAVGVRLGALAAQPLRVVATARQTDGERLTAEAAVPAGASDATLTLTPRTPGPLVVDLALADAEGAVLDDWADAALLEVEARAAVLVLHGGEGPLAASLRAGGWSVETAPAIRAGDYVDALPGFRAIVLDDVAVADAPARFWDALTAAVRGRGTGLLVLAGERAFAAAGYAGSTLESLLPVRAEPLALEGAATVVFAVDKSGSMGAGHAGVDRFRLAQRAVLETARDLAAQDHAALLVFDADARVLMPPTPAALAVPALAREWPATPVGGTRLTPALHAAAGLFESAPAGRRLLVVVSDGRADDEPPAALRGRLARAGVETVWLAVGPDADAAAIERLMGPGGVRILRVAEAADLPRVMRAGVERRRARVERGLSAVRQRAPLPFEPASPAGWPPVAAYATARARDDARTVLASDRGDPLLVVGQAGAGRTAFVASGLGTWAPRWPAWDFWPALAGGLLAWTAGAPPAASLTVASTPDGLQIELETPPDASGGADATDIANAAGVQGIARGPGATALDVITPAGQRLTLPAEPVAPGRWRAVMTNAEPGIHTVRWSSPQGTLQRLHLQTERSESRTLGVNPDVARWRADGLVAAVDAGPVRARPPSPAPGVMAPPSRWLLGLALALALAGIIVDRWHRPGRAARPDA